jgi:hypothetical protein
MTSVVDIFAIFVQFTSVTISQGFIHAVSAGEFSTTDVIFTQRSTFSKTAQIHSKSHESELIKFLFSFGLKYSV